MKLPVQILCVCMLLILPATKIHSQRIDSYKQGNIFPFLYNNKTGNLAYTGAEEKRSYQNILAQTKGSQFYDENFRKATISNSQNVFKVRYNAFLDEIEIMDGNEIVFINKEYQTDPISFTEKNLTYKVLRQEDKNAKETLGYFVVLQENKPVSLYRKDQKKYVSSSRPMTNNKAKFQNVRSSFYVEINNSGTAIKLPTNKKDLAALFPKKETKIIMHIKSEKLNIRKEKDLKKLITYINHI